MRMSDWSSDVCSSDLNANRAAPALVRALAHTPGGAFGSCRFKLKSLDADRAHYQRLIEELAAHQVRYFLRPEARRDGNECVRTCRSRWSPYTYKKKECT